MRNRMRWFFPKTFMAFTMPFAIIALSILFGSGAAIGQATFEPQTTTYTNTNLNTGFNPTVEARLIETHTVRYVEKPVTVVEYIERVKKVPIELRNFSDLEELKQWLADVNTNTTTIYFEHPDITVDCDDFALVLQRKALEDGYLMSFQIIEPGKYNSLFESGKMPLNTLHAINLVVIGNNAYFIEPQTGEIVFAAQLD